MVFVLWMWLSIGVEEVRVVFGIKLESEVKSSVVVGSVCEKNGMVVFFGKNWWFMLLLCLVCDWRVCCMIWCGDVICRFV